MRVYLYTATAVVLVLYTMSYYYYACMYTTGGWLDYTVLLYIAACMYFSILASYDSNTSRRLYINVVLLCLMCSSITA
jgi:hypothetical protein